MDMDWGLLVPITAIACGPIAWIVTTWIRARHGYPVDNKKGELIGREGHLATNRTVELLATENADLKDRLLRLEERIAVLERIATDSSARLEHEIDALR